MVSKEEVLSSAELQSPTLCRIVDAALGREHFCVILLRRVLPPHTHPPVGTHSIRAGLGLCGRRGASFAVISLIRLALLASPHTANCLTPLAFSFFVCVGPPAQCRDRVTQAVIKKGEEGVRVLAKELANTYYFQLKPEEYRNLWNPVRNSVVTCTCTCSSVPSQELPQPTRPAARVYLLALALLHGRAPAFPLRELRCRQPRVRDRSSVLIRSLVSLVHSAQSASPLLSHPHSLSLRSGGRWSMRDGASGDATKTTNNRG